MFFAATAFGHLPAQLGPPTIAASAACGVRRASSALIRVVQFMSTRAAQDEPGDFCLATGESHSVRELCEAAYQCVGLNWEEWVESDPKLYRPADVELLVGDARKAKRILGWEAEVKFEEIVRRMVEADLEQSAGIAVRRD